MVNPINKIICTHCGSQQMVRLVEHDVDGNLFCVCKECKTNILLRKETTADGEPSLYTVINDR